MKKLKVFVTQSGFHEQALAAPSQKAAIELLGITPNSFKHFVKETTDKAIIKAALAKPGTVLLRNIGTKEQFSEYPAAPKLENVMGRGKKAAAVLAIITNKKSRASSADAAHKKIQEQQRKKYLAAAAKHAREAERHAEIQKRRDAKRQAAQKQHEAIIHGLEIQRDAIEAKIEKENARWQKQKVAME